MQDQVNLYAQEIINQAWENRLKLLIHQDLIDTIDNIFDLLNKGHLSICYYKDNKWQVNEWIKKAILLSFKIKPNHLIKGSGNSSYYDKIDSKFNNWSDEDFVKAGFRVVIGAVVRQTAYIGKNAIIMPSFINLGARIENNTLIDSGVTVGSCAYIGQNCHISSNVVIGGVLEPLQANPVIVEDDCFIGACSSLTEGVIIGKGAVIASGIHISKSSKIIDRTTGIISHGYIPPYSVVIPGTINIENNLALSCAVITKTVDANTRSKTSLNDLLRD